MAIRHSICSEYLKEALTPKSTKKLVKAAVTLLKQYDFDAIAFRGISGALIAPLLAYKLNKSLLVIRKPKETGDASHSAMRVEGDQRVQRYIIIDDFQCSGKTVEAIITDVHDFAPDARCSGALFYREFLCDNYALKIVHPRTPNNAGQEFVIADPNDFLKATFKAAKISKQLAEVKF